MVRGASMSKPALGGTLVLDFSTLLPGPLATLMLAQAGARVVKIERPGSGDIMRGYVPKIGEDSVNFALLNRGKESVELDLSTSEGRRALDPWLARADVLIEQFRPGVMRRLGLDYAAVRRINPGIVYCSITGYGQQGPLAGIAGHDLNYMAASGCLGLVADGSGAPGLPPVNAADIAGGSYPAVINILLALMRRRETGEGSYLDIAMSENMFTLLYWALGEGFGAGRWPRAGEGLTAGRTPRYAIYATADSRYLAAAPLEDKFWNAFCDAIDLEESLRDDARDPLATRAAVAAIIAGRSAAEWEERFKDRDVCCSVVARLDEAVANPHFASRGVFGRRVTQGGHEIPALPLPLCEALRTDGASAPSPPLGHHAPV